MQRHARTSPGFTLIELLVVVAVIALLIALLLPAIIGSRSVAYLLVNQSNQRQLAMGQIKVTVDNRQAYASVHTGMNKELMFIQETEGVLAARAMMEGNTDSVTPTSTHDWISPSMGSELNLSPNRAERTHQIFSRFADPAATRPNDYLFGLGTAGDRDDFSRIQNSPTPYPQMSYLSPYTFHYGGVGTSSGAPANEGGIFLGTDDSGDPVWGQNGFQRQFDTPDDFLPRIDRIGNPSTKIVLADGTRYFDNSGLLDFDVNATPSFYGSFLTSTPMFWDSRAYRMVDDAHPTSVISNRANGNYEQWQLSVRHLGNSRMVAAFFDGHTESLSIEEAYGDVTRWAPRGSVISSVATLNSFARRFVINATGGQTAGAKKKGLNTLRHEYIIP